MTSTTKTTTYAKQLHIIALKAAEKLHEVARRSNE
jgi:hypothetical protein